MSVSQYERRQRKYAASLEAEANARRFRRQGKRNERRVIRPPEPVPKLEAARLPRPEAANLRIAELRAQLESNRASRALGQHLEPESNIEESVTEPEPSPEPRKRVRIARPFVLPTREDIAKLCLEAYRIAMAHEERGKGGDTYPKPLVAPAVMALRALTEVCGYTQMKRNQITEEQYAEERASVNAEVALERMRRQSTAEVPKP